MRARNGNATRSSSREVLFVVTSFEPKMLLVRVRVSSRGSEVNLTRADYCSKDDEGESKEEWEWEVEGQRLGAENRVQRRLARYSVVSQYLKSTSDRTTSSCSRRSMVTTGELGWGRADRLRK